MRKGTIIAHFPNFHFKTWKSIAATDLNFGIILSSCYTCKEF